LSLRDLRLLSLPLPTHSILDLSTVLAHFESLILTFSTFPYTLIARNKSEEAKMFPTFFTSLVLLLSTLNLAICSSDLVQPAAVLAIRQVSAAPATADLCVDYEFTANMSSPAAQYVYIPNLVGRQMLRIPLEDVEVDDMVSYTPASSQTTSTTSSPSPSPFARTVSRSPSISSVESTE
jgi:hypothetical protein